MTGDPIDNCTLQAQTSFIRDNIHSASRYWQQTGGREQTYSFGGLRLRVRFAAGALHDVIDPVLAHAASSNGGPSVEATVYAIDASQCSFGEPPLEWPFETESEDGNLRTCWQPKHGLAISSDESRGIWHLMDLRTMSGLYWVRSAQSLPLWEFGSPLRHFVQWMAQANHISMIHAAAISPARNVPGVLLAGAGGSGKSTMTAAAIEAGWLTTGDDFVVMQLEPNAVTYPVFDVMKLIGNAENEFSNLTRDAINKHRSPGEKALVPISKVAKGQLVPYLDVAAVLSLKLTHSPVSSITLTGKTELVSALAPSTMKILRTGLRETFSFCSDLVRRLPCYRFCIGSDPREGLAVLEDFITEELSGNE